MGRERNSYLQQLPNNLTYTSVETIQIGNNLVGKGQPTFIIAEVGANHRGDIKNALKFIEIAAEAGADAIKFQHLTHDKIAADTPIDIEWQGKNDWKTLSEFYKSSEMPYEWTPKLVQYAKKCGIVFLSTPFDKEAVDILDQADVPAFKVASYELTDDVLVEYIAKKGKPMIVSTGMAYLEEVAHAVRVIQETGNNQIILLHCVSIYPPKSFADINLRAIESLQEAFHLPVGFSDHTPPPWIAAPLTAIVLGACVIEKHVTDDRLGGSHDDKNSLNVEEFKKMVKEIRLVEQSLKSSGIKQPVSYPTHEGDEIYDRWTRRSLYVKQDLKKGKVLTEEDIITLRPWGGIEPKFYKIIIGKKVNKDLKARSPLRWEDLMEE